MRLFAAMLTASAAIFAAAGASAQVAEEPGLAAEYPAPQCIKPDAKLIAPQWDNSGNGWAPNNLRIKKYNDQARAFDSCMHEYIDKANAAIKRVQSDANAAIQKIASDSNGVIGQMEAKLRDAVAEANAVTQEEAKAQADARH